MTNRLFVYGTLRRESRNSQFRIFGSKAKFMGRARMRGRLVDLGEYPGLVAAGAASDWVRGEVYTLADPDRTLARLDEYEGCVVAPGRSPGFRRIIGEAALDCGGTMRTWVYVYEGRYAPERVLQSGDYLEPDGKR